MLNAWSSLRSDFAGLGEGTLMVSTGIVDLRGRLRPPSSAWGGCQ
jgi:hypothetical protein